MDADEVRRRRREKLLNRGKQLDEVPAPTPEAQDHTPTPVEQDRPFDAKPEPSEDKPKEEE